ncbi:MAG TPA: helix-turn-helix domain-containing protein, partial [Caldimonas sp.]|nr:helix-turn-helix domain-containing protein [Caldimonas sp.]
DRLAADAGEKGADAARGPTPLLPVEEPLPNDLAKYLDDVERDILVRALEHYRYNRTAAGISLGLSLRQMRYRMARLNVNVGGDPGSAERE